MAEELCNVEAMIEWGTEEGHEYVRCWYCPECDATNYDFQLVTPHLRGASYGYDGVLGSFVSLPT